MKWMLYKIRRAIDPLVRWMNEHPIGRRNYLLCIATLDLCVAVIRIWEHNIPSLLLDGTLLCITIIALHSKPGRDDDNDDDKEPIDPTPTGDTVDRWLRETTHV